MHDEVRNSSSAASRTRKSLARQIALVLAATVASALPTNAAGGRLVADGDRKNVDVFDSPSTACRYWTVYRSAGGITLISMGGSAVNYNAIDMKGLTFAAAGQQVETRGTVTLRCPKIRSIGVEVDPKKTLSLLKVHMPADPGGVDRYVLPQNVR